MIYLAALALSVMTFGFYQRLRSAGFRPALLDVTVAAVSGWLAGLFIGIGARLGMWAIPFFNGTESRFSFEGTTRVVLVFSLYGVALGILYELVFRRILRERGFLFGLVITLVTWYPLGKQGVELLNFSPSVLSTAFFTLVSISFMFIPFGAALEHLLGRWHALRRPTANLHAPNLTS